MRTRPKPRGSLAHRGPSFSAWPWEGCSRWRLRRALCAGADRDQQREVSSSRRVQAKVVAPTLGVTETSGPKGTRGRGSKGRTDRKGIGRAAGREGGEGAGGAGREG